MVKSLLLALALLPLAARAQQQISAYFIDVEGGQATLFVVPGHESLLIDTGWQGNNFRDADRIVNVAHSAGLTRIDYVLITHYHSDHVGGVPQLAARISIGAVIDHGANREPDNPVVATNYAEFQKTLAEHHIREIVVHPGETLPVTGMAATVVSADGDVLAQPLLPNAAPNPYCAESRANPPPIDATENARSLGTVITFGKLRILDLGDLTWDKELELMCPVNKLGRIDILVVSHHGFNQSSSPALVHAIAPRVAIMDNGAKKGGSASVLKVIASSPGLETLWQLHYSEEGGASNTAEKYIANPQGPESGHDSAHHLQLTANRDGSFAITNSRTGLKQVYAAR